MKKLLLISSITFIVNSALAVGLKLPIAAINLDTEITLEGVLNFQLGSRIYQSNLSKAEENVSNNKENFAFFTDTGLFTIFSQKINNITTGAKIALVPNTKITGYHGSHIFFETEYARLELGSPKDAGSKMRITGNTIAVDGGGSKYIQLATDHMKYLGVAPDFSMSNDFLTTVAARKISYYLPKTQGFQLGISYIPDSANIGSGKINDISDSNITKITLLQDGDTPSKTITINQNVKNAVSGAISYEHEFSDDVSIKISLAGEYGTAAGKIIEQVGDKDATAAKTEYQLSDLRAYNLGMVFTHGNFSCAGSYGTLGQSLTAEEYHKSNRETHYANAAVAYTQGPLKTSLSYFQSLKYKNLALTISAATEYKMTPWMLPYAEVMYAYAKGKPVYYVDEAPEKATHGWAAIIGTKLKF